MAVTWKIGLSDGITGGGASNASTTAELNVSNLKITLRNHAEDTASWTCEGDGLASTARFPYGTDISVWKVEGSTVTRVFRGVVTSIPRQGSGAAERVDYEAKGGWYWLTKCFYTQTWATGSSNTPQSKTRVVLGYGPNGTVTPTAQIQAIVNCAIAADAPISLGSASVCSVKLPADEQVDLTCADALNRILAWFPDTVVWFDYSGDSAPAIHLQRRASLSPVTLPVSQAAESVTATPRHDLVVPGVEMIFEITSASGNQQFRDVVVERAPDPFPTGADALGAARFTIQLDGGHADYLFNSLQSVPVTAADLRSAAWWAARIPELAGWSNVTFATPYPSLPTVGTKTLDHELVRGAVQPWQDEIARTVTLKATVSYTSAAGDQFANRVISVTLTMTDAETGVYSFLQSRQAAEDVPRGLAAQVYAAVSHLYYEGRVSYAGDSPPYLDKSIGSRFNLSGGPGNAWASMDSAIQAIEYAVGAGTTTFSFGPPEHLGPQDLVQLALANRKRLECRSQKLYNSSAADIADTPTIGGPATLQDTGVGGGSIQKAVFETVVPAIGGLEETVNRVVVDTTSNSIAGGGDGKTAIGPGLIKLEHVAAGQPSLNLQPNYLRLVDGPAYTEIGPASIKLMDANGRLFEFPTIGATGTVDVVTSLSVTRNNQGEITGVTATKILLTINNGLVTGIASMAQSA